MFSFHYCYTHTPHLRYIPFFVSVYSLLCFVFRNTNVFMLFDMEKVPYCGKANRRISLFECLTVNDGLKWSFSSIHGIGIFISFFFSSVFVFKDFISSPTFIKLWLGFWKGYRKGVFYSASNSWELIINFPPLSTLYLLYTQTENKNSLSPMTKTLTSISSIHIHIQRMGLPFCITPFFNLKGTK